MQHFIRVLVLGTGQMGSGIVRLILEKQGLQLVGVCGHRVDWQGKDIGRLIGLDRDINIQVNIDLPTLIEKTRPHVAIQATCSRLEDTKDEIATLVRHGIHVISIAEEMAFPACTSPAIAEQLHALAVANGVSVIGTGINPGFVLDLLVLTLSGVCTDIHSIRAERVNDLSPYGPSVLASQGVGLTLEEFSNGVESGSVVGHIGFLQSIHMIAKVVGWEIERIEQKREAIVSRIRRQSSFVTVEPGRVAGCLHTAVAYRENKAVITLVHPQQIQPHLEGVETGDMIEIHGTPNLCLKGCPEIPGGQGTCALAVNMIPRVLNAVPGLHTMADLPVPTAMLSDVRRFITKDLE